MWARAKCLRFPRPLPPLELPMHDIYLSIASVMLLLVACVVLWIPDGFMDQFGTWIRKTYRVPLEFGLGLCFACAVALMIFVAHVETPSGPFGIVLTSSILAFAAGNAAYFGLTKYRPTRRRRPY